MNFKQKKSVIHDLGKLNLKIYDCITDDFITDEVIITDEQLEHIRERHPEAYKNTKRYIKDILDDPDYIFQDKRPNTGLVVKKIINEDSTSLLVVKVITSNDKKGYKNSVITGWTITEKRLQKYLRNKNIIYKKE